MKYKIFVGSPDEATEWLNGLDQNTYPCVSGFTSAGDGNVAIIVSYTPKPEENE